MRTVYRICCKNCTKAFVMVQAHIISITGAKSNTQSCEKKRTKAKFTEQIVKGKNSCAEHYCLSHSNRQMKFPLNSQIISRDNRIIITDMLIFKTFT